VQVDRVEVHAFLDARAHEREALRGEAVGAGVIGAGVPLDALKVDPVKVGERVEAGAEGHFLFVSTLQLRGLARSKRTASTGCRAVWMVVILVQGGVVVEVLVREVSW
jgi:hypothetical protein